MKADPLFSPYEPEIIGVHGAIGAGKSFTSLSISQFWPADLPARAKAGGKKIVLEDIYALAADSNPYAGCSILGIEVPTFNLQKVMGLEAEWKKHGFNRRPTIIEAMNKYATELTDRCLKGQTHFGLVDTVSSLDSLMVAHHEVVAMSDPRLAANDFAVWKLNFFAHQTFVTRLKSSGALVIIYDMHSKAVDDKNDAAKKKNLSVLVAGGARFAPAITGQSAGIYKRDPTMQLVCVVKRVPGKKGAEAINRILVTDVNDEAGECKQRYGGILPLEMKPDLRAAFKMIRAAQSKWK